MHDDLITALAKIRDLKVISRTSVMPYKTGTRNLRKIAEELGVATVLEGSVQRAGNRVRINMQLGEARAAMIAQRKMDAFTLSNMRFPLGQLLIVCDQREEAIAVLREHLGSFSSSTPGEVRRDPIWSRLKDDPRFEEILRAAKPL